MSLDLYEKPLQRSRDVEIAIFQYAVALVFLWLLTGFWQLQVRSPEIYAQKAERNRVKSIPILAPRGKILDRDGRMLVNNVPSTRTIRAVSVFVTRSPNKGRRRTV